MPDCFQRFFKEHAIKFTEGNKFFLTQMSADHITGLFGIAGTLQDQRVTKDVQLYGPPGLNEYLSSIGFRLNRKDLFKHFYSFFGNRDIFHKHVPEDSLSKYIEAHIKHHEENPHIRKSDERDSNTDMYYKDKDVEIHPVLLFEEHDNQAIKPSLCYILQANKVPGKVNSEKLKAHNIPKQSIGKLFEAGEIEVNGVIHKAQEFKDPDQPSPLVIIIDCPTKIHLEALAKQEKLKELFVGRIDIKEKDVKVMVHLVPTNVLTDPRYQDFLKNFQKSCQHIFVNADLKPVEKNLKVVNPKEEVKENSATKDLKVQGNQIKYAHFALVNMLAKYFPDHFPVLNNLELSSKYDLNDLFPFLDYKTTSQKLVEHVIIPVKNEGLRPVTYAMDKTSNISGLDKREAFIKKYEKWAKKSKLPLETKNTDVLNMFKACDPELVFLGTQGMKCSACCGVSGIYLRFWQQGDIGFLLDCGEGSYFQLLHHYGHEKTRELLKTLKVIYITHIHSDHHMGLLQLIKERDRVRQEDGMENDPIFLVIPFIFGPWVDKFYKMVDQLNYKIVFCHDIKVENEPFEEVIEDAKEEASIDSTEEESKNNENEQDDEKLQEEQDVKRYLDPNLEQYLTQAEKESKSNVILFQEFLAKKVGIVRFNAVDAQHCIEAYGVYMEHKDGWSFVYSGDSRPCDKMVEQAKKATILVHEATFAEELQHEAVKRTHSTDVEAVGIGMRLGAWRTVLTHFSFRYELKNQKRKNSENNELNEYYKNCVVKAYDHFQTRFSELERMPKVSKCIAKMFDDA